MARDFKIELDNVEMINGSDDLLKDTKVTKVTLTGENKLNSLNSTFENCTELTAIEGDVNLDGVSDMTEMTLNTPLDELKVTNPTEENIQTDNSLNQVTNVKIGGTKYAKGGVQDVVGSLEWNAENFAYEDAILDNVYTNSSSIEDNKNLTISNTLEQKATSIEITGQTYENLVDGKATKNLLDEMSMQQTEGKPTQFTPHIEQPVCVEAIEGETYQNLIEGKGEYKLTDTFSTIWTESNNSIENPPSVIEVPEIWGNTVQGYARAVSNKDLVNHMNNLGYSNVKFELIDDDTMIETKWGYWYPENYREAIASDNSKALQLKPNTSYSFRTSIPFFDRSAIVSTTNILLSLKDTLSGTFTTDDTGLVAIVLMTNPHNTPFNFILVEGDVVPNIPFDLNYIQSVGDLYVDESGEPILDEEGNEQYKLEIESSNKNLFSNIKSNPYEETAIDTGGWGGIFYSSFDKCTYKLWKNVVNGNSTPTISILSPTDKGYIENKSILQKGKTYTLSGIFKWSEKTQRSLEIGFFDAGMNLFAKQFDLYGRGIGSVEGKFESRTFTLDKDAYGMYIKLPYGGSYAFDLEISNFMIEENTVATDYVSPQSNKTTILMPQPLRKVDSVSDKLYWDNDKKKYIVEKNIDVITPNISEYGNIIRDEFTNNERFTFNVPSSVKYSKGHTSTNDESLVVSNFIVCNYGDYDKIEYRNGICKASNQFKVFFEKGRFITVEKFKTWFENSDTTFYYSNTSPQIIETKILEKPSLETYSPKTYITTNTEIQPSQMTVINKRNLINLRKMKSNTDYTLQLKCNKKGNKPIKINLCGKEKDIDATIGVNHINVTTNELNDNRLELSGEGNIVSEIIVVEGEMNQYPKYFNGVQSTGELQDDGTYKIDIETSSEYKEVNIFNSDIYSMEDGTIDISSGINQNYANESRVAQFIPCVANTEYRVEIEISGGYGYICYYYDANKKYLGCNKEANSFYAITEDKFEQVAYVRFRVNKPVGSYNNVKLLGQENTTHKISIISNSPLAKGDKLYWNKSNKRYEIDRNGEIEVPIVEGDIIDLPRLYQRDFTTINISTDNIKPSKIDISYKDIN